MPVRYKIERETCKIWTRCLGAVSFAEVMGHFKKLEADPAVPARLDVLLDLRETTTTPETTQLRHVAQEIKRLESRLKWGACAIVAPRDALFGMSRMFEVFTDRSFSATRVFREFAEAQEWLDAVTDRRG
jgi:hypothetical protein